MSWGGHGLRGRDGCLSGCFLKGTEWPPNEIFQGSRDCEDEELLGLCVENMRGMLGVGALTFNRRPREAEAGACLLFGGRTCVPKYLQDTVSNKMSER